MDDSDNVRHHNPRPIPADGKRDVQLEAWMKLRGALKDVYAKLGGGEAYLRREREEFNRSMEAREREIERLHIEAEAIRNGKPQRLKPESVRYGLRHD